MFDYLATSNPLHIADQSIIVMQGHPIFTQVVTSLNTKHTNYLPDKIPDYEQHPFIKYGMGIPTYWECNTTLYNLDIFVEYFKFAFYASLTHTDYRVYDRSQFFIITFETSEALYSYLMSQ